MNTYGLLGGLLIMAGLGSWAVWERGDAANWHSQYISLQASYSQAADKAKADALAQEQKDLAALHVQSSQALKSAQSQAQQAQTELQAYLAKGKANKADDLDHKCWSVPIPADEIP